MSTNDNHDKSLRAIKIMAVVACALAFLAFGGAAWAIINQQIVATNLCDTINAGRAPDAGYSTKDPHAINNRQELRDLWAALGHPERSDPKSTNYIPNASILNCSTGQPVDGK